MNLEKMAALAFILILVQLSVGFAGAETLMSKCGPKSESVHSKIIMSSKKNLPEGLNAFMTKQCGPHGINVMAPFKVWESTTSVAAMDLNEDGLNEYQCPCDQPERGPTRDLLVGKVGGQWQVLGDVFGYGEWGTSVEPFLILDSKTEGYHDICQDKKVLIFKNGKYNSESNSTPQPMPSPSSTPTSSPEPASDVWKDPQSGLMWQVSPTGGMMEWQAAKRHCDYLSLGGYGHWRLPTITELRSLIRGCPVTQKGGICSVTDSCLSWKNCRNRACKGCSFKGGPSPGGAYWPPELSGEVDWYWSSSPGANQDSAWGVDFHMGYVNGYYGFLDNYSPYTRCVRP